MIPLTIKYTMLKIIQYGNPILEERSLEVTDYNNKEIQNLIDEMLKVLDKEKDHSAGLSAPQVSNLLRIAICRRTDIEEKLVGKAKKEKITNPDWEVMINPELVYTGKEISINWEGCLSINYGDLFGKVPRSKEIEVKYLDRVGNYKNLKAEGFFSHVIQHEIDHLNGVLFLKYIPDPNELFTGDEITS